MATTEELERRVAALERKLRGGVQVNSLAVSGNLAVGGNETVAGTLVVTGAAALNGGAAVTGDLTATGRIETAHGTWTPTFKGSGTAGVFTYTQQQAQYIKIGKLVYVQCRIAILAIGTPPTGNMTIEGLPFTSETTNFHSLYYGTIAHLVFTKVQELRVLPNSTTITMLEASTGAAATAFAAANFTDVACDLILGGFYQIP